MTTQDMQKIVAAMQPLDQFASQAPLPRAWHAQWQAIFRQVVDDVQAVAVAKPEKPADDETKGPT